jgi:hypothetical protein
MRIARRDDLPMTLSYFADVDIKCASTYFQYGAALFYKAQDEQDVFGSTLQAATAHEDAEAIEEESSGKRFCVKTRRAPASAVHCFVLLPNKTIAVESCTSVAAMLLHTHIRKFCLPQHFIVTVLLGDMQVKVDL